jgi:simple sugar transport system substrate-binding protein
VTRAAGSSGTAGITWAAAAQGIVIMQYNAGQDFKDELGAINYFGSDEYVAGVAGGKYMADCRD